MFGSGDKVSQLSELSSEDLSTYQNAMGGVYWSNTMQEKTLFDIIV
jgi:hypothetical protein